MHAHTWTKTYHFFPEAFIRKTGNVTVEKKGAQPFNQLLVSWTADLPAKGYLRFSLEVFDEKLHKWSTYKMYEWGKGINHSFLEKDPSSSARYVHVRFEGAHGRKYHQFRINVQGYKGADTQVLRSISVCASDLALFKPEPIDDYPKNVKPLYIQGVPILSQHSADYTESTGWCSPASIAQVIGFYTNKSYDVATLAQEVFDSKLSIYGSWPFNTALAGVYLPGYLCYVARLNSLKDIIRLLKRGCPVILSICSSELLPGALKPYDKGHLITVVGIDLNKREIICHDTAEKNVQKAVRYPLKPFVQAWENRYRLAYVIVPYF